MKKLILLFTIGLFAISCSNDDDNKPDDVATGIPMLTKATTYTNNVVANTYTFTYDSKKRIDKITVTGEKNRSYLFAYNPDDQISTISVIGDDDSFYSYTYDEFKRLKMYMINFQGGNVTYDANTDLYTFSSIKFGFDQDNDLNRYGQGLFNFVAEKKGAMYNAGANYHLLGIFLDQVFYFIGGHKQMDTVILNGAVVSQCTNTFSDSGYPIETIVSGLFVNHIKYEYTNM
ncbi:hypothetical protein FNO01nite_19480 [Flavobacterium noncentrifugens]|uniref:Uncharacterized protein n=1 Tax=Flavobacterium noncentrifugens TaxID=1128970 RepID=A0A1G8YM13_9FLAO|nr:hypothetical protein [Flavobacterium noncentrifugens]GEP51276.1 hypothetical protein FNO01nite_19480 [Flavobacterium noncentrifugens]SDK03766.1 hypothetical protein SAMN04487935_2386 [Flavobacterium noncentrifugens]